LKIFAIGDLHLGFAVEKPMDIFGDNWIAHENTIKKNWMKTVSDDDLVLIPGDISWASHFSDAKVDLDWIDALPGRKILSKGNHDYWWQSMAKMTGKFKTIDFLHNNYYGVGEIAICGTRGWVCPNDVEFTEQDEKIYKREAIRLRLSLESAVKAEYERFIVMLHYPPTNDKMLTSLFTDIIKEYGVEKVVFGHLHSFGANEYTFKGMHYGTEYLLTSADYLKFSLIEIIEMGKYEQK
jgi:predicted phosphohydrolase